MPETGSIQLVPMTPAFLEALLADRREESEQELGISLYADYPDEDERRFLAMRLRQMHEDARFTPGLSMRSSSAVGWWGTAATTVRPGTTPPKRLRPSSSATRSSRLTAGLAEKRAGIRHFVVAISPDNSPSLAIAHKLGFVRTGERVDEERGLEHVFELKLG